MNTYHLDFKASAANLNRRQKTLIYIFGVLLILELLIGLIDQIWTVWLSVIAITSILFVILFRRSGNPDVFLIVHRRIMENYVLQKKSKSALEKIFLANSPFARRYRFKQVVMIREYREDGSLLSETPYHNGRINGERKIFSPSGKLRRSTMYLEDEQDGWDKKLDLGQVSVEQHFKDARLHGVCKEYDPFSGILLKEITYDNNMLHGPTRTYHPEQGYILEEIMYQKGARSGISKTFYDDGNIKEESEYETDMRNGITRLYYKSGKIKSETNYHNNKKEGPEKTFYEDGGILSETIFRENKETDQQKFYDPDGNLLGE